MKYWINFLAVAAVVWTGCSRPSADPTAGRNVESDVPPAEQAMETAAASMPGGHLVAAPADTATLKVKFVYGGDPPPREKIDGSKDPFCGELEILSEKMVIGADGGIQNLALYMDVRRSDAEVPEAMLKAPPATVVLDNKGCVFVPHVIKVRPGQTIEVKNSDGTGHNANFSFFNNQSVNFLIPAGGSQKLEITAEEPAPIPVECNVHPWMKAYVIVTEHPYVGVTNEKGELEITDLPVGNVTFKIWHENSDGSIDEGLVNGKKERWSRGRMEVELKPGVNDLGTITLAPDMFKQ
ncbi:MAG: methylamine utilization protein [Planctomycetota bacterium]|nr:MAG: methylamine utilization protein [Planctomycetota bacterium]